MGQFCTKNDLPGKPAIGLKAVSKLFKVRKGETTLLACRSFPFPMTYPLLGKLGFGLLIFFAGFCIKAEKNNQCVSDRIFRQENSGNEHKARVKLSFRGHWSLTAPGVLTV